MWRELSETAKEALSEPDTEQAAAFAEQIQDMVTALDSDDRLGLARLPKALKTLVLLERWVTERLLLIRTEVVNDLGDSLSSAGEFDEARTVVWRTVDWIHDVSSSESVRDLPKDNILAKLTRHFVPSHTSATPWQAVYGLWLLYMCAGKIDVASNELERSVEIYDAACALCEQHKQLDFHYSPNMLLQAKVNKALSLAQLGRYSEAKVINQSTVADFEHLGDYEAVFRTLYTDLWLQWKEKPDSAIAGPLRTLIEQWEGYLSSGGSGGSAENVEKGYLWLAYKLLLGFVVDNDGPVIQRAENCLALLKGLREPYSLAQVAERFDRLEELTELEDRVNSLLEVLDTSLQQSPKDTAVLFVEMGRDVVGGDDKVPNFLALQGGHKPLRERVILASGSPEWTATADTMLQILTEDLDAILAGQASAHQPASQELLQTGEQLWNLLPNSIRTVLSSSTTILFSPDPDSSIEEIPLELLKTDRGWFGLTHVVSRFQSLDSLFNLLLPNGVPTSFSDQAYIVRAEEPPGYSTLDKADDEVIQVARYFSLLGLDSRRETTVTIENLKRALDQGFRIFHYVGHGVAGNLAEGLPLTSEETMLPSDLITPAGFDAALPFIYLSACEVGRSRYVTGGRQSGMATEMLDVRVPAVIACLQVVPDSIAGYLSQAFYRAAKTLPVGPALRLARRWLDNKGINPVCWSLSTLYGDPQAVISSHASSDKQQPTFSDYSWATYLCRYLAGRSQQDKDACCTHLASLLTQSQPPLSEYLEETHEWIVHSFDPAPEKRAAREALCRRVASYDLYCGVSLRLLLAMEFIESPITSVGNAANNKSLDSEALRDELMTGRYLSNLIRDPVAWAAFITHERTFEFIFRIGAQTVINDQKEALRIFKGWAHYNDGFAALKDKAQEQLSIVENKIFINL
jgi:hypothetical protein